MQRQLEMPLEDGAPFRLRFLLQAPDDPSLMVDAAAVWKGPLTQLGRAFRDPQESLLESLGRAARLFPPLAAALAEAKPDALSLDAVAAWTFLEDGAAALAGAGFGVLLPAELTARGQRRLRLQMRVGKASSVAGAVATASGLGLDQLVDVSWEAALGDEALTAEELEALAAQKAPLVRFRGAWVAIDPGELGEIRGRLGQTQRVPLKEAVTAVLAGEAQLGERTVTVAASGAVAAPACRRRVAGARKHRRR